MKALSVRVKESIEKLRWLAPACHGEVSKIYASAADALEELSFLYKSTDQRCEDWETEARDARRQRDDARAEVERVKKALHDALAEISRLEKMTPVISHSATRPEPSRLEIAAMLVAGRFSDTVYVTEVKGTWIKYALDGADALIAAAKEVTK